MELACNKIESSKVRTLTEIEEGYKLVSMNLLSCYNGIHPDSLSKLSNVIFNIILHNKMYIKKGDNKYKENEAKRIFSTILSQPSDLAYNIHPVKYLNGESTENDISNIVKRIDELEEYNMFYVWKFKQPYTYIYIMERYINSWKYYNKKGILSIKSLRKITSLTKDLIDTMICLENKRDRSPNKEEIEESFGYFINKLLTKIDPNIEKQLTKFTKGINIYSYISTLVGELKKIENTENIEYDEQFINRLPTSIKNKLLKLHSNSHTNANTPTKVNEGEDMNLEMSELIPQNPNIVKAKKTKINKQREIAINILNSEKGPEAEDGSFNNENPFKNPRAFTIFYRSSIKLYNGKAVFYDFVSEIKNAADIMDLLLKNNRNDLKFLKAWIRNYLTFALTGNNVYKEEKTSLKTFKDSFEKYNNIYIG